MTNTITNNKGITLKTFLNTATKGASKKEIEVLEWLDYDILWRYVNEDEKNLIDKKILKVEEKNINTKKMIVNISAFREWVLNYSANRRHLTIAKFIKKSEIELSYSFIYNFILDNEKVLENEKVISISMVRNKRNIKVLDSEKMEKFLNENS
ncbi:hypothetical protein [Poseidonibacter ostreae]|uniref:Uncharacterized protein n=1 Tax=Poseidonibacter ostreae TaxID=2654171 RepID=A0A6L4WWR1_9BACT|nr:hypothetical protein [Poseidonibacter ostreae]KAB7891321.1 hypothetical protein GBG19_00360 [Poseidonibacter ostreae]